MFLRSVTRAALVRFLLVVIALAIVLWLIVSAWGVLTPFVVGAVLAYVLLPVMNLLDRWLPRWLAILLVFAAFLLLVVLAVLFVVPSLIQQLVGLVQALPDAAQMHKLVQQFDAWVKTLSPQLQQFITDAITKVEAALKAHLGDFVKGAADFSFGVVSGLLGAISSCSASSSCRPGCSTCSRTPTGTDKHSNACSPRPSAQTSWECCGRSTGC